MTQTRDSQDLRYRKLAAKADKLFYAINAEMDRLSPEDERWRELHDVFKLAQVITSTLQRYAERQDADNAPVPYQLNDGLRDLDAAIRAENPGHAVFAFDAEDPW
jgi:hypothetical protein